MGDHGIYVIAAYVVAAIGLSSIVAWSFLRLRAGRQRLERELARQPKT